MISAKPSAKLLPVLLLAGFALLAACTTEDKAIDLGNGVRGYRVTCGGLPISTNGDCDSRAAYICGDGGYTVLKDENPPYAHTEHFWRESTRDIVISCNAAQSQQEPQIQ